MDAWEANKQLGKGFCAFVRQPPTLIETLVCQRGYCFKQGYLEGTDAAGNKLNSGFGASTIHMN